MYFLQKVCFLLTDEQERPGIETFIRQKGFGEESFEMEILDTLPAWENWGEEGVLWVTDCVLWAHSLQQRGEAVLIYLHKSNGKNDYSAFSYAMMHPEELEAEYFELIYRRMKGLPWDILETERLAVRESTVEDVDAFYEIYKEPSITAYMENLFPTRQEESAYIEEYIDKVYGFYDFGIWTVLEKESGKVVGRAGLSYREGYEEPELGFVIGVPWQGRGYAREVCEAILEYGRRVLGFNRIQAFVRPENFPSLSLCRSLGFHTAESVECQGTEYVRLLCEE